MNVFTNGILFIIAAEITAIWVKANAGSLILLQSNDGLKHANRRKSNLTNGMFFGVVTMPSDKRQNFSYNMWMKDLKKFSPNSESVFVCAEGKEIDGIKYLHPTKEQMDIVHLPKPSPRDRDISMKRLIAAKYFIENTTLKWFWSTSEDCAIDLSKLESLLEELDFLYDTENDLVFLGQCIFNDYYYLHGGSGYIFSRKAAEQFAKIGEVFISNIEIWDDYAFHSLYEVYQLKADQTATSHLNGVGFDIPYIKDEKMENVEYCPRVIPYSYCYKRNLYPINDLIGYHRSNIEIGESCFNTMIEYGKKYKNLYFYYNLNGLKLCKKKKEYEYMGIE